MRSADQVVHRDAPSFQPAWWLRNAHAQTIYSSVCVAVRHRQKEQVVVQSPDGDRLGLFLTPPRDGFPTVMLFHGLESSPQSASVSVFARALVRAGFGVAAAAFRGVLDPIPTRPATHHAARFEDMDLLIEALPSRYRAHGVHLVGISLGASLLGSWLGERGESVPQDVRAAALISTPFMLARSSAHVEEALWGVYTRNFLKTLVPLGLTLAKMAPAKLDRERIVRLQTIAQFDDAVIAPLHGYRDAAAYYEAASVGPRLHAIRRPTLVLSALDDPFHPRDTVPLTLIRQSAYLEDGITERGGHVGWIEGAWPARPQFWAPKRLLRFLEAH